MTASFRSTVSPPQVRRIPETVTLVDPVTGAPVGIQNPNANGFDGLWSPVDLTAAQIAAPTAAMIADINSTYRLNVAPYTRYQSDGTRLVALGASTAALTTLSQMASDARFNNPRVN